MTSRTSNYDGKQPNKRNMDSWRTRSVLEGETDLGLRTRFGDTARSDWSILAFRAFSCLGVGPASTKALFRVEAIRLECVSDQIAEGQQTERLFAWLVRRRTREDGLTTRVALL